MNEQDDCDSPDTGIGLGTVFQTSVLLNFSYETYLKFTRAKIWKNPISAIFFCIGCLFKILFIAELNIQYELLTICHRFSEVDFEWKPRTD